MIGRTLAHYLILEQERILEQDTGLLQAAESHAVIGDTAKALEWLDKAVRMGDDREDWMRRDPLLTKIRDHPRFQQMLASVAYRRKQRPQAGPENR